MAFGIDLESIQQQQKEAQLSAEYFQKQQLEFLERIAVALEKMVVCDSVVPFGVKEEE